MRKISVQAKRRMTILLVCFIFLVSAFIYSMFNDILLVVNNKKEATQLSEYYNELLTEEESLASEVTKLQDDDYVARYAREKYMYSLPDEYIIKIDE